VSDVGSTAGGPDLGIPGIDSVTEIGRTAETVVYRVRDTASGRDVLIKVLDIEGLSPEGADRFGREQSAMESLSAHPNLIAVYGHGFTPAGQPYVATEDVAGGSVVDRTAGPQQMTGPDVLRNGIRLTGAVESAHRVGVVHGDLRPDSIVVPPTGEPRIGDFGLAGISGPTVAQATDPQQLAHVAPELLEGQPPTPSSDVYALGSVMYTLLGGEPAFVRAGDTSVVPVIKRIASDLPPDLRARGVPEPVAQAVATAMGKDPAQRPRSVEEFGRALQQAEVALGLPMTEMTVLGFAPASAPSPQPVAAQPAGTAAGLGGPPRSRAPWIVAVVALLALFGLGTFLLFGDDDGDDAATATTEEQEQDQTTTSGADDGSTTTGPADETTTTAAADGEFVGITDDTGALTVDVPAEWSAVDGEPLPAESGGQVPNVQASTDLEEFRTTYAASGVDFTALDPAVVPSADPSNMDGLLDAFSAAAGSRGTAPGDACTSEGREDYDDGVFTGRLERFALCDGAGDVVIIAAADADRSYSVVVQVVLTTPTDEAALDQIIRTFLVSDFP
jgi:hypothetical protein